VNASPHAPGPGYRWIALSNTTLGVLAASMNGSILLISLPAIFRGIGLDPLGPSNINYLLWTIMGYMVATAVLVVAFGRLGDILGRARMYNLGFAIFTLAGIALCFIPGSGSEAATYLIVGRIVQGVGGALLMANATAILTDAGWQDIDFEPFDFAMIAGAGDDPVEDAMSYFQRIGPAARALREMDESTRAQTIPAIRKVAERNLRDGLVALHAAVWIVTARRG